MILKIRYQSFWTRISRSFIGGFLTVTAIIIFTVLVDNGNFDLMEYLILGTGVFYMIKATLNAWVYVYEIKIADKKVIVTGSNLDKSWDKEFDISNSEIKIKSFGRGRGNVEYYLQLRSNDKSVDINKDFNWDYPSLLTIFNEFKRLKGEKIIFDENYYLGIMERKAKGLALIDINLRDGSKK